METDTQLLYIQNGFSTRDLLDNSVQGFLSWPVKIETAGTERNIPEVGSLVVGFMPHSGWVEPIIINKCLEKVRRKAVWMTKMENGKALPSVMASPRLLFYVDRESPGPTTFETAAKILANEGVLGSALEGTRRGNPDDPNDLKTLAEALPGLMYMATKGRAPLVGAVILGCENYLPQLEQVKAQRGIGGILKEIVRRGLYDKTPIQVRFTEPYTAHLGNRENGIKASSWAGLHTEHLVREQIIPEILKLDPDYPLGYYK